MPTPNVKKPAVPNDNARASQTNAEINLEFDRLKPTLPFSEKIPEVWKNQSFGSMAFSIEKCRDLK